MTEIVRPQFVPWLRTGLAAHITNEAVNGLATTATASTEVAVRLRSTGSDGDDVDAIASPPIDLLGPAHVVGLDPAQIVRRDPLPDADDAEPNYFTTVELAAADLPWRYTPAAASTDGRLQPWLVLVVVQARAGVTLEPGGSSGLDVLRVDAAAGELPDLDESWAWAHVQADDVLADGVPAAFTARPEAFRSRLMCPRRLTPNTAWIAALVPSFEAGRAAGLRTSARAGQLLAWTRGSTDVVLPVYSSWRFSTGPRGDFESLVTRLKPRELPADIGRRALDLSDPGGGLPSRQGATTTFTGALVSFAPFPVRPPDAGLTAIEDELPKLLNGSLERDELPADYRADLHDPVVGPTTHATHPAGQRRVPPLGDEPKWFGELNIEPHHRAAAGLGAEIVRRDQEALMGAAWAQADALRPVNDLLRRARAAWEVAGVTRVRMMALSDDSLMQVAAPAAPRLRLADGSTVHAAIRAATIPRGLLSVAFRRRCATTPSFAKRPPTGPRVAPTRAVTAACLDDPNEFVATWTAVELATGADLLDADAHEANVHLIERDIMDVDESTFPDSIGGKAIGGTVIGGTVAGGTRVTTKVGTGKVGDGRARSRRVRAGRAAVVGASRAVGAVVDDPILDGSVDVPTSIPVPASLQAGVRASLDPQGTIAAMLDARISGLDPDREHPAPAGLSARPQFTTPMYSRLAGLNPEFLLPGIGTIPNDTVALLDVNPSFIEAYLAGLNHEMGRELLWREYPARLDATWFQQFWNTVDGSLDIVPIRSWAGSLGGNRPQGSEAASLVLLVTGTLLRRYPDTRIYAVEAEWSDGLRFEKPNGLVELPVFSGTLAPGVRFFGFTLDDGKALGSTVEPQHPGYFFVFEEQPHAPRFGLDTAKKAHRGTTPKSWSSMSWAHLAPVGDEPLPDFVDLDGPSSPVGVELEGNGGEDRWGANAGAMARITLQRPVRMLVHADSMLPPAPGLPFPDIDPKDVPDPKGPRDAPDPKDPIGTRQPRRPRGRQPPAPGRRQKPNRRGER